MRMMSPNTLMYTTLQTIPQEGCSSIGSTSTHNNDNNANNTTAAAAATHRIPNHTAAWRIGHTESSSPQSSSSAAAAADVISATASSNNVPSTASASASVDNDVINDSENIIDLSLLSNIGLGGVQCSNNNTSSSNNNNNNNAQQQQIQNQNQIMNSKSLFHDKLLNQPSTCVEAVLSASCEAIGFDIAEVWLRTGPKTHQLINSHLRPAALENSIRKDLVDVYYGDGSSERTHRLSPALCKRAKEAKDVVWVTSHNHNTGHHTNNTQSNHSDADLDALRTSISDVRTAVAVPVCHDMSNTNITFIYFSLKRTVMHKSTVEFLVHMSLSAAVASVNSFIEDIFPAPQEETMNNNNNNNMRSFNHSYHKNQSGLPNAGDYRRIHHIRQNKISVTGANLTLRWNDLRNVEYLTDGGNSWIHTAVMNGKPVVVKTLKPECQDVALAINEIEAELDIHSKLNHPNIVSLIGAGSTSKGVRFVVLERLDGGTLTQMLGYDTRIRDRRRRFWKRRQLSYHDSLIHARNIADSMVYLHGNALPGSMCLHRDIKPDNIGEFFLLLHNIRT